MRFCLAFGFISEYGNLGWIAVVPALLLGVIHVHSTRLCTPLSGNTLFRVIYRILNRLLL